MRKIVVGKLHGIHVTEANLNYHGSITLGPCPLRSGWNPAHGIRGDMEQEFRCADFDLRHSRRAGLTVLHTQGAAARSCQPGDQIIVCNSIYLDEAEITSLKPRIDTFDQDNRIRDNLSYSVDLDADGRYSFSILDEANTALVIPALI